MVHEANISPLSWPTTHNAFTFLVQTHLTVSQTFSMKPFYADNTDIRKEFIVNLKANTSSSLIANSFFFSFSPQASQYYISDYYI